MRPRAALIVLGQLAILSKSIHLCVNTEDTLDTLNLMWTLWTVSKPPFSLSRESDFQFSFFHKRIWFTNTHCPRCLKCLNDILNNSCVVVGVVACFVPVHAQTWTVGDFVQECPRWVSGLQVSQKFLAASEHSDEAIVSCNENACSAEKKFWCP